ncbi:MAG: hypothetical protein ACRDZN_10515 [Acidimicrobiales bacterium]
MVSAYLNLYVPKLMIADGIAHFFREHRGQPFVSSALMDLMTKDFVGSTHRFIDDDGVDGALPQGETQGRHRPPVPGRPRQP